MMLHKMARKVRPAGDPGRSIGQMCCAAAIGTIFVSSLAGCVNVTAPDKPIVIELNINIRQEVIYRLDADAASTIEENPEIF